MEYTVIYLSDSNEQKLIENFTTKVNAMIKEGWKPIGGICANLSTHFFQAMIRE